MSQAISAKIDGEPLSSLPEHLYIPPNALEISLEAFEGPLDLLLYLVRRQNIDILNIPIAPITQQYMEYIQLMKRVNSDLASEYLVMASVLAEIKSRMMLPKSAQADDEDEADPRAQLVWKLQLYEQVKLASQALDNQFLVGRDIHLAQADIDHLSLTQPRPDLTWQSLTKALHAIIERVKQRQPHYVEKPALSVNERVNWLDDRLAQAGSLRFEDCFDIAEGRAGIVISFLAILEMLRDSMVELWQSQPLGPVYLRKGDGQ